MKMETVKPIPPSIAIDAIMCQLECAGIGAHLSLTANHENDNIPKNLPKTRPAITAKDIPWNIDVGSISKR